MRVGVRKRRARRDDQTPAEKAHSAREHAERVEFEFGPGKRQTMDAYEVAADAYEDIGATGTAHSIRMQHIAAFTGKGYPYGISPPHGIFVKGTTMAYIKNMVKRSGSYYFNRGQTMYGPEKFYGPYIGPGGVFFVQVNRYGASIHEINTNWRVSEALADIGSDIDVSDARRHAQELARGRKR